MYHGLQQILFRVLSVSESKKESVLHISLCLMYVHIYIYMSVDLFSFLT